MMHYALLLDSPCFTHYMFIHQSAFNDLLLLISGSYPQCYPLQIISHAVIHT